MKKSNVPTMPERIYGIIATPLVQPTKQLVTNLHDLHKAELLELLEDVELLIAPDKAAEFQNLKKQYTA